MLQFQQMRIFLFLFLLQSSALMQQSSSTPNNSNKCLFCNKNERKTECEYCQCILYCSISCCIKDDNHAKKCKLSPMKSKSSKESATMASKKMDKKMGLVGLINIGNTCYLNSTLQCLSHTIQLTQYFTDGNHLHEINELNVHGSKGTVTKAYANLISSLWFGTENVAKPVELKEGLGKINCQFSMHSQEDANELLIFLIDTLHEDLNRVREKPKMAALKTEGKSMEEAAMNSWLKFYAYNQSIITDVMTGLFRSTLCCRECKRESPKFEPFRSINLPIPSENDEKKLKFYVLFNDFRRPVINSTIQYKLNMNRLSAEAAKKIGSPDKKYRLFFLSKNNEIQDCDKICEVSRLEEIMEDEQAFLIELSREEDFLHEPFALTVFFSSNREKQWVKRPFFFDLFSETGETILNRIAKYLYNTVFCYRVKKTVFGQEDFCMSFDKYLQKITENKMIELKLLKVKGRHGRKVNYQNEIGWEICPNDRLSDIMLKLVDQTNTTSNNVDLSFLSLAEIERHFELKVEFANALDRLFSKDIIQQMSEPNQPFNFDRLYDGMEELKKDKSDNSKLNVLKKQIVNCEKKETEIPLEKCLDLFQLEEQLQNDITMYCHWCQKSTRCNKRMSIYQTPDILIFVLNRFKVRQNGKKEKKKRPVTIAQEVNLENYVVDKKPITVYIEKAQKKQIYVTPMYNYQPSVKPIQKFELYAFIEHEGEINHGHYTAYAKNCDSWYFFNDEKVKEISIKQITNKNAYILFYKRKKK